MQIRANYSALAAFQKFCWRQQKPRGQRVVVHSSADIFQLYLIWIGHRPHCLTMSTSTLFDGQSDIMFQHFNEPENGKILPVGNARVPPRYRPLLPRSQAAETVNFTTLSKNQNGAHLNKTREEWDNVVVGCSNMELITRCGSLQ